MKNLLVLLLLLIGACNALFAVPDEGNIRIDAEGEHCLNIYPSSEVKWDVSLVEKNLHPSTWTADSAVVTVYRDNAIIKNDVIAGSVGKHKIKYPGNGNYKIVVQVQYNYDSGCKNCTIQYPSKTFFNQIKPILVTPIQPVITDISQTCPKIDFSSEISCGEPSYTIDWTKNEIIFWPDSSSSSPYTAKMFMTLSQFILLVGDLRIGIDVTDANGDYGGKSMVINVHKTDEPKFDEGWKYEPDPIPTANFKQVGVHSNPHPDEASVSFTSTLTQTEEYGGTVSGSVSWSVIKDILGLEFGAEASYTVSTTKDQQVAYTRPCPPYTKAVMYAAFKKPYRTGINTHWDCTEKTESTFTYKIKNDEVIETYVDLIPLPGNPRK